MDDVPPRSMNPYIDQLQEAAGSVVILSPTTFAWQGIPSPHLAPHVQQALTPATARSYLLYNLQHRLYNDFYGHGPLPSATPDPDFLQRLQDANHTDTCWDPGWMPISSAGQSLTVQRGGLTLIVTEDEYRGTASGQSVALRLGKDLPDISPGYYLALGNIALTPDDERDLLRLYWYLGAEGAILLMDAVTASFNAAGIPFRLKTPNNPLSFTRRDAAILYLRAADYPNVCPLIEAIYATLSPHMKDGVPALTKQLAPGLALAEDRGGQSFGLHRSMLIAEALANAYDQGNPTPAANLASILDRFHQAGIDPQAPYLNPGSTRHYPPLALTHPSSAALRPSSFVLRPLTIDNFLHTAHHIGMQIVRDAIWHDGQCNWIGALPPGTSGIPPSSSACRALGPDLYAGTSGVALFLSELFAVTGDPNLYRTALGAFAQALANAHRLPPTEQLALYTGTFGIIIAALRSSRLLQEDALQERALRLLDTLLSSHDTLPATFPHDYLSGRAGAIVALLDIRDLRQDDGPLDLAARLGDDLLHAAQITRRGYSWPSSPSQKHPNLTGLSHGVAGIALALLELAAVTHDSRFSEAARHAFAYERSWFDPQRANWPDFRFQPARRTPRSLPYRTFWCHGAPGIALSRLRARALTGDPLFLQEALTALETTHTAVTNALNDTPHDLSLCHGLVGNCEVLLSSRQTPDAGPHTTSYLSTIFDAAALGIRHFDNPHQQWPCGVGGGHTPSLMLGTAGIGLFYLRLHTFNIPSPLLMPLAN